MTLCTKVFGKNPSDHRLIICNAIAELGDTRCLEHGGVYGGLSRLSSANQQVRVGSQMASLPSGTQITNLRNNTCYSCGAQNGYAEMKHDNSNTVMLNQCGCLAKRYARSPSGYGYIEAGSIVSSQQGPYPALMPPPPASTVYSTQKKALQAAKKQGLTPAHSVASDRTGFTAGGAAMKRNSRLGIEGSRSSTASHQTDRTARPEDLRKQALRKHGASRVPPPISSHVCNDNDSIVPDDSISKAGSRRTGHSYR